MFFGGEGPTEPLRCRSGAVRLRAAGAGRDLRSAGGGVSLRGSAERRAAADAGRSPLGSWPYLHFCLWFRG